MMKSFTRSSSCSSLTHVSLALLKRLRNRSERKRSEVYRHLPFFFFLLLLRQGEKPKNRKKKEREKERKEKRRTTLLNLFLSLLFYVTEKSHLAYTAPYSREKVEERERKKAEERETKKKDGGERGELHFSFLPSSDINKKTMESVGVIRLM